MREGKGVEKLVRNPALEIQAPSDRSDFKFDGANLIR
jgi:hypothetical protein